MSNPRTVKEAVDRMIEVMSDEEKQRVIRTPLRDISYLHSTLGRQIRDGFGLWSGNKPLTASCASYHKVKDQDIPPDQASLAIMIAIRARLTDEQKEEQ